MDDNNEYDKIFLNEVKEHLETKYSASPEYINLMLSKLKKQINDDPVYIYHWDSEYWADYIVEVNDLNVGYTIKDSAGLTSKKKAELKQIMGKYSGKASLSLLNEMNKDKDENCERYCTPLESLEQSLIEMKLMREGKIPKKSWWDLKEQLKDEEE